ncbi:2-keto-4-pentenoate hydratase [Micromonospora endophytica]|uniref:2-keto-4-pentenoate hydratase n=1 Tax=Micromonospora endophytica TaxID=515350 RepID=UPI000E696850|nr:fumarylacetoacetate hydrolase family protein [Micromonospora endophytica]RIW49965.1 2-keto-4-pentenoate hydratase [Micromonospora endophytica]
MPTPAPPPDRLGEVALSLRRAATTSTPVPAVRAVLGATDTRAAYEVQRRNVAHLVAAGDRVVGRKIGLTSTAVQRQLGVNEPDFGTLLDSMRVPDGGTVDRRRLLQPKVEAEIAFELAAPITEVPDDPARLVPLIRTARPAIEIVDSRIERWDITIVDTIADNASSGLFVLGDGLLPVDPPALAGVAMRMRRNGVQVSTGRGADCLGSPLLSLHWLATTMAALGDPLQAGDIVLSGALGPMCAVEPGDTFAATVGDTDVSVSFSEGTPS